MIQVLAWQQYGNLELLLVEEKPECIEQIKRVIKKVATGYPTDEECYELMWTELEQASSLSQLQVWANHYTIDDERFERFEILKLKELKG